MDIALSVIVIMLIIHSVLDWRKINDLQKRVSELEYKNKHKIFTGDKPVNKLS